MSAAGARQGSAPARCWRQRGRTIPARDAGGASATLWAWSTCPGVRRPPLGGLIDDLYYLEGVPPYARLTLPPMPAALLIVSLGSPFRIRAGTDVETAEYADGCVVTMPTRALEFGYPTPDPVRRRALQAVGAGAVPADARGRLCDRPVTVEQVGAGPPLLSCGNRLATADGPHEMLTLLEEELTRRLCETAGLGLVRHTSSVIATTSGAVAIGDSTWQPVSAALIWHSGSRRLIGVTPKRLARTYRFAATVFAINPAGPIHDWGDLASGAGYFDQAHFGHGSGPSPGSPRRRAGTSKSGGSSCANIPATRWTTGRCGRLNSYKSDNSRHANLGAPQSKGEPRGQGGHVQLGVGRRLHRGRERPARTAVRLVVQR